MKSKIKCDMKFKVNDIIKVKQKFYHLYSNVRIFNQSYVVISNKPNMFMVKGLKDDIERFGFEELFDLDFRVMRLMKLQNIKNSHEI
jgi:hypothetical protein